jgi:hypothetical protein
MTKKFGLTEKFLTDKIDSIIDYWKNNYTLEYGERNTSYDDIHRSLYVEETEGGNLCFILNGLEEAFKGNYKVIVNPENFDYQIKQYQEGNDYLAQQFRMNLDETIYTKDNCDNHQRLVIEACIAKTLLGIYCDDIFPTDIISKERLKLIGLEVQKDTL